MRKGSNPTCSAALTAHALLLGLTACALLSPEFQNTAVLVSGESINRPAAVVGVLADELGRGKLVLRRAGPKPRIELRSMGTGALEWSVDLSDHARAWLLPGGDAGGRIGISRLIHTEDDAAGGGTEDVTLRVSAYGLDGERMWQWSASGQSRSTAAGVLADRVPDAIGVWRSRRSESEIAIARSSATLGRLTQATNTASVELQVVNGVTGRARSLGSATFAGALAASARVVPDLDGDGTRDFLAFGDDGEAMSIKTLSGEDGRLLWSRDDVAPSTASVTTLRGQGHQSVYLDWGLRRSRSALLSGLSGRTHWTTAADEDTVIRGARNEGVVFRNGSNLSFRDRTGVRWKRSVNSASHLSGHVGDANANGWADLRLDGRRVRDGQGGKTIGRAAGHRTGCDLGGAPGADFVALADGRITVRSIYARIWDKDLPGGKTASWRLASSGCVPGTRQLLLQGSDGSLLLLAHSGRRLWRQAY